MSTAELMQQCLYAKHMALIQVHVPRRSSRCSQHMQLHDRGARDVKREREQMLVQLQLYTPVRGLQSNV